MANTSFLVRALRSIPGIAPLDSAAPRICPAHALFGTRGCAIGRG